MGYSLEGTIQDLYVIRGGTGGCERKIFKAVAILSLSGILRLGEIYLCLKDAIDVADCKWFAHALYLS